MNPKNKLLIKDTIVFGLGSFGSKVIMFLLVPLYTNYMTTGEYGTADLITVLSSMAVTLFTMDIHCALLRFSLSKDENQKNVARTALMVCVVGSVVVLFLSPLAQLYPDFSKYNIYIPVLCVLYIFRSCGLDYLKVADKNRILSLMGVVESAILAVTNIILIRFLHLGADGYMIANIAAYGICTLLSLIISGFVKDAISGVLDSDLTKRMLVFSLPLLFNGLIWWVNTTAGKVILPGMMGASALGIYTAASKIPTLINLVIGVFHQSWGLSSIREIEGDKDISFFSNVFVWYSMSVTGAGIALICLVKPFVTVFMGADFHDAWMYAPLLLVGAIFYSIGTYYEALYIAMKKTLNSLFTSGTGAIFNVVLSLILTNYIGVWGVVIGYCVGFFVLSILRFVDMNRILHLTFSKTRYLVGVGAMIAAALSVSLQFYEVVFCVGAIVIYLLLYGKEWFILARRIIRKG